MAVPAFAGANRWTPFGPPMEEGTYDFRIDPYDPTHWILQSSCFLESRDGGKTVVPFASAVPRETWAIEFDPFVRYRLWAASDLEAPDGLFVSRNGGSDWQPVGATAPYSSYGRSLLVSAPRTLLLATRGIYRSTDNGYSWKRVQAGFRGDANSYYVEYFFTGFARDPHSSSTVYALGSFSNPVQLGFGLIYRSDNGGRTWREWYVTRQLYEPGAVGFDPWRPHATYVTDEGKLRVTTDGGASFRTVSDIGMYTYTLLFDRAHQGTIYAAGQGLMRSRDGGLTWKDVSSGLPSDALVTTLVQDPVQSQTFYAVADSVLYSARFTDGPAASADRDP